MRWFATWPLALFACVVIAGCGHSDDAGMPINGNTVSLSVIRDKPYFWSEGWDIAFVVSRMPDCTRRHHVQHVPDGSFRVDVYDAGNGGWILNQGQHWYVADTATCEMQQFDDKPPFPGNLTGSFVADDGTKLTFKAAPADATPPAAPAQ